ncbi:beta-glucosidase BglX [Mucilaginibacter sp. E4BP6]|uniref:beta-glucosidase BglX n=1 Tax=Mucilaginibacter sp. E4BP6 TaxID=2723089 RepID=UPI0015CEDB73|nr:beta-glucosidase BglX [Mucilaginibacter sp. E4BP6]NYE67397.1 beta-glucosidase [Mucilaginibacter sp. E4BP6]
MLRKPILLFMLMVSASSAFSQAVSPAQQKKMDAFINNLMSKMTLDEKIGQLNQVSVGFDVTGPIVSKNVNENIEKGNVGAVLNTYTPDAVRKLQQIAVEHTRLKIPLLFGYDVIHGHKTIFPIPLGLASSWDLDMIKQTATIAAQEASADGINWVFSPMVDIARDPRWGRIAEGSGEDTWLGSQIAKAMVQGYQGDTYLNNDKVMACVKHFALYGAVEAGRDYNTVDMSERRMFQDYLPPYKAAVDAGAGSVMSSFNEINGVPASGNKWLMTDLLRKKWGFNGFVVTDYTAINEMIMHGMGETTYDVAKVALDAGIDMDMVGEAFLDNLKQLVKDGKVQPSQIDIACRRVLEAKYKLGLFADPYRYCNDERAQKTIMKPEFLEAATEAAKRSIVLLKNSNNTLPLKTTGSIALIGPLADDHRDMIGPWSGAGDWQKSVSVLEGIKKLAGNQVQINYAKGANITNDDWMIKRLGADQLNNDARPANEMIDEAVNAAKKSDIIVAVVGESYGMSGEAASRSEIGIPSAQEDLLKALKATGKPMVIILMNGRPLTLKWENDNADAMLETWFAGTEAGNAIADVLFGEYNPSAKITATFPQDVGQIPLYYSHKNTGRPYQGDFTDRYKSRYLDISNDPLYPFGFGLSYTTFTYGDVKLSSNTIKPGQLLQISTTVTNTGKYDGTEIVQLYTRQMVGSVTRPVEELKNFKKIFLKAGESQVVNFTISSADLRFYDINMKYTYEPGDFKVFVGTNSRDVKEANFKLTN